MSSCLWVRLPISLSFAISTSISISISVTIPFFIYPSSHPSIESISLSPSLSLPIHPLSYLSEWKQVCETCSKGGSACQMKHFCETSSIFWLGKMKNETVLRGFLSEKKAGCRPDFLVSMWFAIFPLHGPRALYLMRGPAPVMQNHLSETEDLTSKMQPLTGN